MSKNTNIGVNVGSGWEAGGYVDASKWSRRYVN